MSAKDKQDSLVEIMRRWQRLETASIAQSTKILENTTHPLLHLVAEIIQRDSAMHHRIQQMIIDSYTKATVPVPVDEIEKIWDATEKHTELEKKTIELAVESLSRLEGSRDVVQRYLVSYLMADEKKHDRLLEDLSLIKQGMRVASR